MLCQEYPGAWVISCLVLAELAVIYLNTKLFCGMLGKHMMVGYESRVILCVWDLKSTALVWIILSSQRADRAGSSIEVEVNVRYFSIWAIRLVMLTLSRF